MNSSVHCREESSGKDYHLTLVYPKDANADEGKISILAPVGSALLGLQGGPAHRLAGTRRQDPEADPAQRRMAARRWRRLPGINLTSRGLIECALQFGLVAQVQIAWACITEQARQVQISDIAAVTFGFPALPDDFLGDHANSWSPNSSSENSR